MPIGVAALFAGAADPRRRDVPQPAQRFDWLGLALLSPGLALLIYGLAESAPPGGFGPPEVLRPGARRRARCSRCFVRHALRTPQALIDLRLFTNRTFAASSATLIADDHLRLRRHAAAAALPAGGARRVGAATPACCWRRRASAR